MLEVQTRDLLREFLPARRYDTTVALPTPVPDRDSDRVHTRKARYTADSAAVRRGRAATDRLAASEGRLFIAMVVGTGIVCALLMGYLVACARVASLGIQQSRARVALSLRKQEMETLRAEVAGAESPAKAEKAAADLHMVLDHHLVCYVMPDAGPLVATAPADPFAAGVPSTPAAAGTVPVRSAMNQVDVSSYTRMASRDTSTSTFKPAATAN